jgi:O-antigen/teichoic acid export membrane protein
VGAINATALCRAVGSRPAWSAAVLQDFRQSAPSLLAARSTGQLAIGLPAVLIGRFIGPEATVIYSVSVRSVQVAEMVFNLALTASSGAISHLQGGADRVAFLRGLGRWALVVAGLVVLSLAMCAGANSGFVRLWVGADHYAGQGFTLLAVVAGLAAAALRSLQHLSFNLGATNPSARLWSAEFVARALLLVVLIPIFGIHGAPLATLLAVVLVARPVLGLARRTVGPWPSAFTGAALVRIAVLIGVVCIAALVSPWLIRETWWQWIASSVVLAFAVVGALALALPGLRAEAMTMLRLRRSKPMGT